LHNLQGARTVADCKGVYGASEFTLIQPDPFSSIKKGVISMADHDKDRTNPTARPAGLNTDAGNSSQDRFVGGGTAGSTSGTSAGMESSGASASGKRTVDEAKQYAGKMAGRAKEQGRSMFGRQKDSAAQQLDSVVHAFRNTAGQLEGEGQSQTGRYVNMTADRLESFGRQLREKDMDSLVHDAENLSRRAPGAFFAGSLIAGFLFARFLKSSAQHRHAESEMASDEWDMRSRSSVDSTDTLSDVRAAASTGAGSRTSASSVGAGGTTSAAGSSGSVSGSADLDTSASSTTGTLGSLGSTTPPTTSTEAKPGGNSYGNR
jgi:hypothetical protein